MSVGQINELLNLLRTDPEVRKEVASYLANDIIDELSEYIRKEIENYANTDPVITRRNTLKAILAMLLITGGISKSSALTDITDRRITIDGKEMVFVSPGATDGQIIVRQGNNWQVADPSVDKWAGTSLTPRDITLDLKRLTDTTLSYFQAFRVFTPNFFKPLRTFNLYLELTSDSIDDEVIQVVSGTGTSDETTEYIDQGEIAWVESAGLEVEFSSTPDITWNANKYVRLQRKHYPYGTTTPTLDEEKYGGKSSNVQNWRHVMTLSDFFHYIDSNRITAKSHLRHDFIAPMNNHYWFRNEQGDEYIKIVADAGCFTYTNDVPVLYMKGMVFSVDDILATP